MSEIKQKSKYKCFNLNCKKELKFNEIHWIKSMVVFCDFENTKSMTIEEEEKEFDSTVEYIRKNMAERHPNDTSGENIYCKEHYEKFRVTTD